MRDEEVACTCKRLGHDSHLSKSHARELTLWTPKHSFENLGRDAQLARVIQIVNGIVCYRSA